MFLNNLFVGSLIYSTSLQLHTQWPQKMMQNKSIQQILQETHGRREADFIFYVFLYCYLIPNFQGFCFKC